MEFSYLYNEEQVKLGKWVSEQVIVGVDPRYIQADGEDFRM